VPRKGTDAPPSASPQSAGAPLKTEGCGAYPQPSINGRFSPPVRLPRTTRSFGESCVIMAIDIASSCQEALARLS
jgi:hypothetical protein